MNKSLLHRINAIESEMAGEMDLRAVATHPLAENWADPARTDLSAVGFESAQPALVKPPRVAVPPLLDGPYKPRRRHREPISGQAKVLTVAVIVTFAACVLASIWPTH